MAPPAAVVETVRLFGVSRPHAALEATWPGGSQRAQTPRALDVPKGAQIKLVLSAPGYESAVRELTAAAPQAVTIKLTKSK